MVSSTADIATVWTCESSRPVAPASSAWTIASRSIVTLRRPSDQARPAPRGDDHEDAGGDGEIEAEIDRALRLPALLDDARHHALA